MLYIRRKAIIIGMAWHGMWSKRKENCIHIYKDIECTYSNHYGVKITTTTNVCSKLPNERMQNKKSYKTHSKASSEQQQKRKIQQKTMMKNNRNKYHQRSQTH